MYRQLRQDFSGRIVSVTLERPERRNAFRAELMREMIGCAQELSARQDLDVVIVTGAGGFFSAGADLKDPTRWALGKPLLEQREIASLGHRMARAWEELPRLVNLLGPAKAKRLAILGERGGSIQRAAELAAAVLEKPRHSVSYMAHDQLELAAASPESRAAREAALKRRKT